MKAWMHHGTMAGSNLYGLYYGSGLFVFVAIFLSASLGTGNMRHP